MKQNLLKTCLVMLFAVLGVSMSWAETVTLGPWPSKPISGSNQLTVNGTLPDNKSNTWNVTITGSDASKNPSQSVNSTNSYWQLGANGNIVTAVFSTDAVEGTITNIAVNCAAYQGKGTASVTVGGADFGTQNQKIPTWSSSNGGTLNFAGSASGTIAVTLKADADGRAIYIKSITVTYAPISDKTVVSIAASGTPADLWTGDTFSHEGVTITATYDDASKEDVTSVCAYSGYDMSVVGTQTVTATYQGKTCTYDVDVKTIANTASTAYTTAEAIALIDAGKGLATEVYVTGVVSKVESYNDKYHSITYWLDDNSFEVYGGLAAEGDEFTSKEDIEVGATVIVLGKITIYKGTYEANTNNRLVSYTAPAPAPVYTEKSLTLVAQGEIPNPYGEGVYPGFLATFSSDKDVFIPMYDDTYEFSTYVYTVFTDGVDLLLEDAKNAFVDEDEETELPGYYVPANNGVLLFVVPAEEVDDITIPYYEMENVEVNDLTEDNMLRPASAAMEGDYKFYKLAYDDYTNKTGLGFYWGAADGAAFTAKAGGAYLAVPKSAGSIKGFRFDGGDVTGIQAASIEKSDVIYNLQGQRVVAPKAGVYVKNGKKVVVK